MTNFKLGDFVDIVVDGSVHKGMPHKFYHGKTGRVFNVNKHAIGVIINKKVKQRIMQKKIHVKVPHLRKSKCREDFLQRIKVNDQIKAQARKEKKIVSTKRTPATPREAHLVDSSKCSINFMHPKRFIDLF